MESLRPVSRRGTFDGCPRNAPGSFFVEDLEPVETSRGHAAGYFMFCQDSILLMFRDWSYLQSSDWSYR
jgi:hypothetical protein